MKIWCIIQVIINPLFQESCVDAMSSDVKGMNVCKLKLPARTTLHGRSGFYFPMPHITFLITAHGQGCI